MKIIKISLLIMTVLSLNSFAQTKKVLRPKGMFIMEKASCAGLQFNNDNSITFINEMGCSPWELRANWIDDKTFIAIEKEPIQTNCPPRVMVYKIISFDGKILKLNEFWTGWGNQKDEMTVYTKN